MKKTIQISLLIIVLCLTANIKARSFSNQYGLVSGADPFILEHKDTYYLYCTTADWLKGIPVYKSKDLVNWVGPCGAGPNGMALHEDDVWGDKWFWSGDVIEKNGKFYMYASAAGFLIAAVSDSPLGPFTQTVKEPMNPGVYEFDAGAFADDDGKYYIYFSRYGDDGTFVGVAELSDDMIKMKEVSECFNSISNTWERGTNEPQGRICEGPYCLKHKGTYYLIYCANLWQSKDYAIGYATSSSPIGPWTKYSGNPIIKYTDDVYGPGNGMLINSPDKSEMYMVYHAHHTITNYNPRKITLDKAWFEPDPGGGLDILVVDGPTVNPIPYPSAKMPDISSHTVAYWRLEEGSAGSTHATDLDGYFVDSSVYSNHMSRWYYPAPVSAVPAATIPQSGTTNEIALNLCKRINNDANIMCITTHSKPVDSHDFSNGFTIECAMKNRTYSWNATISKDGKPNTASLYNPFKLIFRYDPVGDSRFNYEFIDGASNVHRLFTTFPFKIDEWYWVACVCDGDQAWLYVKEEGDADYDLEAHVTGVTNGLINTTDKWSIGRGCWDGNTHVNAHYGSIDEVRITEGALSPNQFLAATGGAAVSPVAYWRFEEGTNGVHQGNDDDYYVDSSGNGNHMATDINPVLSTANPNVPFANIPQTRQLDTLSRSFNTSIQNVGTFGAETGGNIVDSINLDSFTIECMAKTRSYGWQGILVKDGEPSWNNNGWVDPTFVLKFRNDAADNHKIQVAFWDENTNFVECLSSFNYNLDEWYQIAVVYDDRLGELSLYIKSEGDTEYQLQERKKLTQAGTLISGGLIDNNYPWAIGRGMHWGQELDGLDGLVDEVRICNIVLDIKYFLGHKDDIVDVSSHTLAYWKLDEGTAGQKHAGNQDNFYKDYSGNNNNLSTWWEGTRPTATTDRPFTTVPQTSKENILALDFDGNDDLGTFGAQTGGKMIESYLFTNGWTIECSFKFDSYGWQVLVGKDGQPKTNRLEPIFYIKERENSKILEVGFYNNATNITFVTGKTELELGKWYSIAAVLEKDVAALYLKGENDTYYNLEASVWVEGDYAFLGQWSGKNWTVGRGMWAGYPVDYVDGKIDEVRICKIPLSEKYFLGSKNIIFPFLNITNSNIFVPNEIIQYTIGGTNNSKVVGIMSWINNISTDSGYFPANLNWSVADIPLEIGTNVITVSGTNIFGDVSSDSVTMTRELPEPCLLIIQICLLINVIRNKPNKFK